jgi:hypothetical protein
VIPEVLTIPTGVLDVTIGESITPPEPERDKDIFPELEGEKKKTT